MVNCLLLNANIKNLLFIAGLVEPGFNDTLARITKQDKVWACIPWKKTDYDIFILLTEAAFKLFETAGANYFRTGIR